MIDFPIPKIIVAPMGISMKNYALLLAGFSLLLTLALVVKSLDGLLSNDPIAQPLWAIVLAICIREISDEFKSARLDLIEQRKVR